MPRSRELAAWIAQGERCAAADTIVEHLTGVPACAPGDYGTYPQTPGALRRCLLLLEAVPALAWRLDALRELGPQWSAFVQHWHELEDLFAAEGGFALEAQPPMPQTDRLLSALAARSV